MYGDDVIDAAMTAVYKMIDMLTGLDAIMVEFDDLEGNDMSYGTYRGLIVAIKAQAKTIIGLMDKL